MRTLRRAAVALSVVGLLAASLAMVAIRPPAVAAALCNGLPCYTVTILLGGNGSGTLVSTNSSQVPDGLISCTITNGVVSDAGSCSHRYTDFGLGITFRWKLTPATGSSGCVAACSAGVQTGTEQITADSQLAADLNVIQEGLAVDAVGSGTLTVNGLSCTFPCTPTFNYGTTVTLVALPGQGNVFLSWDGACAGQGATCTLVMTSQKETTAHFGPAPFPVEVTVTGSGTVVSTPSGINCTQGSSPCTGNFPSGSSVSLKATPSSGWTFQSWGGLCAGQGNPCTVTWSPNPGVTAKFVAKQATPPPATQPPAHTSTPGGPAVTPTPTAAPGASTTPIESTAATEAPGVTIDSGASVDQAPVSPLATAAPVLTGTPAAGGDSTLIIVLIIVGLLLILAIVFLGIQLGRLRPKA